MTLTDRGNECRLYCKDKIGERCHGMLGCQGSEVLVAIPDADSLDGLKILGRVRGRQGLIDLMRSLRPDGE